jgi:nicotinamidase/pyrazinamidase
MKTLVIVDVQRDFCNPEGALYVKGGEALPEKIAGKAKEYDAVIMTLDWHPANHCSFKCMGGLWPEHCIAFTDGAGLPKEFGPIMADGAFLYFKGQDPDKEEYGAFSDLPEDDSVFAVLAMSDRIDVCGIAGEYCVKETTANLLNYVDADKVNILMDLTVHFKDDSTHKAFIKEKGLNMLWNK